jgi:hypothetical protein
VIDDKKLGRSNIETMNANVDGNSNIIIMQLDHDKLMSRFKLTFLVLIFMISEGAIFGGMTLENIYMFLKWLEVFVSNKDDASTIGNYQPLLLVYLEFSSRTIS